MGLLIRTKQYLSMLLYFLGISSVINRFIKLSNGNNASLLVLCYHSIRNEEAALFERQLDYLLDHRFRFISGDELLDLMDSQSRFDKGAGYVCLTFDDCYEDNYQVVREILLKRNIPAIFFAPSRKLGTVPVWYECGEQCRIMSGEQLIEMAEHFEIGAHSRNHIRLGEADISCLPDEISGSKADLELLLRKKMRFFAFPNGSYNSEVLKLVDSASYHAAFTIEQHTNYSFSDKYSLGRYLVNPDDYLGFKLKAHGGYDWFFYFKKLLRKVL